MRSKLITLLMIFLVIPPIYGISIELSSPLTIMQGETETASFIIKTDSPFNGIVDLTYNNIDSSVSSVTIVNTSFNGAGPYIYEFDWNVKGITPNQYIISADLKDEASTTLATNQTQGLVESSAPLILSKSPNGIITSSSATLQIITNEDATCKYDSVNTNYNSMAKTFELTGETTHTQNIIDLEDGPHSYYVRCKDSNGYEMNESALISFIVDLPPYAEISLSDPSPVKAGTIEVTLLASEELEESPVLEYSFDSSPGSKRLVSLTRDDDLWKGYMIITDVDDNKIGTFYFSGKNKQGSVGSIIKEGKTFIVDTTKPPVPVNLEAVSKDDGKIELNWYYEGEEIDYFKVYRSTSSGVDYLDYYSETSNVTRFIDSSTEGKVTYYYKINAIDMAGNPGQLSEEVYATSTKESSKEKESESKKEEAPKVLPPNLVIKVNDEIKQVEKLLIDIEEISTNFENDKEQELITDLELTEKVMSTKTELESLNKHLADLKLNYKTESELDYELDKIDLEIKKIQQTTPKEVTLIEKSDSIQSLGQDDVDLAIDKLFMNSDFSSIDKNKYKKQNKIIQDNIEVLITSYAVEIEFINGEKQEKTLIIKSISYKNSETIKDVILFEIIPKGIAESSSEINFLTKNYEVIEEDPIVKFGFPEIDFSGVEIKYIINKRVSMSNAEKAVSVALVGPVQLEQSLNEITGFSVASIFGSGLGLNKRDILFILLGIAVIGSLAGYQVLVAKGYNPNLKFVGDIRKKGSNLKTALVQKRYDQYNILLRNRNQYDVLTELIDWSHGYLDKDEINRAELLYPKIKFLYRSLSKKDKLKVFKKCLDLQERIVNKKSS